jgi:dUTP pyrophosphatase
MKLFIKPLDDNVKMMYKNHTSYNEGDSGLDLFFPETIIVESHSTLLVDLKIQCEGFHDNEDKNVSYYLYPRSSISKTSLRMANSVGIIDAGYRGNIMVAVDNINSESYTIEKGQRLFQICGPTLEPVKMIISDDLSNSQRGSNGFGSTGD